MKPTKSIENDEVVVAQSSLYGTPLYVISATCLRQTYADFTSAFADVWPSVTTIAYPYKANGLRQVCKIFHEMGAWAEVSSALELEAAQRNGVEPARIVFNGPYKSAEALAEAIAKGCRVNVDNWSEIDRIEAILSQCSPSKHTEKVNIGIRIAPNVGIPKHSKFGFSFETDEIFHAIERITKIKHLRLNGLHTHIGTNICDVGLFEDTSARVSSVAKWLIQRFNLRIDYVDMGGGLGVQGARPYFTESWNVPSYTDYARAITTNLSWLNEFGTELVLEPGRSLVSTSGQLLLKVVSVKPLQARNHYLAIVDGGVNVLPSAGVLRHDMRLVHHQDKAQAIVDIAGPLCMQNDILAAGVQMQLPSVGDLLALSDVGAYDIPLSVAFTCTRAPVILLDAGQSKVIRRRETLEDLWNLEIL